MVLPLCHWLGGTDISYNLRGFKFFVGGVLTGNFVHHHHPEMKKNLLK